MEDRNQQIKNTTPDLSKLRMKAGKASDRVGQFLMPFAFGVAPLVQILGSTPPLIPTSRAAQIPLFKLIAGEGDKPIINHILAVTNSRLVKNINFQHLYVSKCSYFSHLILLVLAKECRLN